MISHASQTTVALTFLVDKPTLATRPDLTYFFEFSGVLWCIHVSATVIDGEKSRSTPLRISRSFACIMINCEQALNPSCGQLPHNVDRLMFGLNGVFSKMYTFVCFLGLPHSTQVTQYTKILVAINYWMVVNESFAESLNHPCICTFTRT